SAILSAKAWEWQSSNISRPLFQTITLHNRLSSTLDLEILWIILKILLQMIKQTPGKEFGQNNSISPRADFFGKQLGSAHGK
ncbi:MAG: hypothetical protein ACM3YE_15445, partial [Bacteroidota bacterium]